VPVDARYRVDEKVSKAGIILGLHRSVCCAAKKLRRKHGIFANMESATCPFLPLPF